MRPPIISREQVARELSVSLRRLTLYESHGLIRAVREGHVEGYEPTEVRRIWSIVSYQRDMGINLAGVEALLRLREHLVEVYRRVDRIAREFQETLGDDSAHHDDA